jgi:hypothetical protein
MPRFYFHVRSDRHVAKDGRGRLCANNREAYAHAIGYTPALLRKFLQGTNTFVSTQICDAKIERSE